MSLETYVILKNSEEDTSDRRFRTLEGRLHSDAVLGAAGERLRLSMPSVEIAALSRRDIADLARDPGVAAAAPRIPLKLIQPVARSTAQGSSTPEKIAWGLRAVGADSVELDGSGVKVAVLDTGIDAQHDAFRGVTLAQVDFTGSGNGDQNGHGTHCAGTIFGREINGTRIGVAPGITEAFIGKVLDADGSGNSAGLATAITAAVDAGCQVVSMSLSFDWPGLIRGLVEEEDLPVDLAAAVGLHRYRANVRLFDSLGNYVEARARHGSEILLVAAAGNDSKRDVHPTYQMPAAPPSEAAGFLSVGAVGLEADDGPQLVVASFSNTACDVCAPGVGILSADANTTNEMIRLDGTSMATPHVAGVAALWLQRLNESPSVSTGFFSNGPQLRKRIEGSATTDPFRPDFDPVDVGMGFVRSPREE